MKTFINFTNHPFDSWSEMQKDAARSLGKVIDIPFPVVRPEDDIFAIEEIAKNIANDIKLQYPNPEEVTVMIQGEMTLLYQLLKILERYGYRSVAATTQKRDVIVNSDGTETRNFEFYGFRDYY